jgi:3-oxoacyl-[acyl-carrier-protein] synthase II
MRRVVVTGMGGITALGESWSEIKENMQNGKTATRVMHEWSDLKGMNTCLGAPIPHHSLAERWSRKKTRTMGPVSLYSVYATEKALIDAGLLNDPILQKGKVGVAYGSSFGSTAPMYDFAELLFNKDLHKLTSTSYIRMMGHTAAVNIGLFFQLKGRIIPTATACTSGSLAIGYAAEAIRYGKQDIVIAGGAEELCPSMAAVFDVLYATSTTKDPSLSPRPYDAQRDGLVLGEGATSLILEDYDHARAREATIYAEIVGFATNMDGNHITQPSPDTIKTVMESSLEDAQLSPHDIGFVSGHGTATEFGDIVESTATHAIFGSHKPIHSLKSFFGHTLGTCGALESWLGIEMMRDQWIAPTANLVNIDDRCAPLHYIKDSALHLDTKYFMNNNYAFGGINTSLIFKKIK